MASSSNSSSSTSGAVAQVEQEGRWG
jgi:hypothetical protein